MIFLQKKRVVAVSLILFQIIVVNAALALDVADHRKARSSIVIPDAALPVVKYAAEELQYHIDQATGVKLAIVRQSQKPTDFEGLIYIGNSQASRDVGIDSTALPPNAFVIKSVGSDLFLVGHDSPGNPLGPGPLHTNNTQCGSLFAVYDLLENQMGGRWLWPGKLGEVIPPVSTLRFAEQDSRWIPQLLHTRVRDNLDYGQADAQGWTSLAAKQNFLRDQSVWLRRHRFRRGISLEYGHAFTHYWKRFGKTHPEYFNLLPDGQRISDPNYWGGSEKLVAMDVAEPALWKQIVNDWEKNRTPQRPWINGVENDTSGKCICEKCLAWDVAAPGDEISIEKAKQDFIAGKKNWPRHLGSLGDRYAKFYLAIQKEAEKIDPQATVLGYAYANYKQPPIKTKLNDRVVLAIVPAVMYPWTDQKRQAFREQWDGWAATGVKLYLRPNYFIDGHNMPVYFADKFAEDFAYAYQRGMIATDFDHLTGQWATQGPNLYVLARIHTRPDRSVSNILHEYYSGFGPAKSEVALYFQHWKRVSDAVDEQVIRSIAERRPEGGGFSKFHRVAGEIFTPSVMNQGRALLQKAKDAAKGDPLATQRIDFLIKGLCHAQLTLDAQTGYDQYKNSGDVDAYSLAIQQLDEFRSRVEKDNVANMGFLARFESRTWNRSLLPYLKNPPLPGPWTFQWDPDDVGQRDDWFGDEHDDASWHDIDIRTPWEKQPVGKQWKEQQGADYDGIAWYRTRFDGHALEKNKQYKLIFGAVDEACTVWLNGEKILVRSYPYQNDLDSWMKAFDIEITKYLYFDRINTLAVRVEDKAGAGGIWKPVLLAATEAPVAHGENLLENPGFEAEDDAWQQSIMAGEFLLSIDKSISHTGKSSAKIECVATAPHVDSPRNPNAWGRWVQSIPVQKGSRYDFRCFVKTPANFSGKIQIFFTGGKNGTKQIRCLNTRGLWQQLKIDDFVAANNKAGIFLNLYGIGEVRFDDIEVTKQK